MKKFLIILDCKTNEICAFKKTQIIDGIEYYIYVSREKGTSSLRKSLNKKVQNNGNKRLKSILSQISKGGGIEKKTLEDVLIDGMDLKNKSSLILKTFR